ncbi:MAG: LysR family transcriptional regulator [Gammaproteobacteria bacterium]|nr:LysR family transcriptional regulator [Gammaproteobacteria bacterium]
MSLLSPQLSAFMAVVKCKTVHAAAKEIHLTQTAVTQRIRTLENALKTTLFIRTRRGMQLTQEGAALLRYCQAACELEGEALAIIQGAGVQTEVEITVSAPTSIMRSRVIPSCLPIVKQFANLLMHFNVSDVEQRHQSLRAGQSDLVIIQQQHLASEMQHKRLAPEQYVLVGAYNWKGRKLRDIVQSERIIDFNPADQVTYDYLKQYELFDIAQRSRYFVNRTDDIALLVSEGVGYTALAKEFATPYVEKKQLTILNKGKTYNICPLLAWFDRPEPPEYFSAIVNAIV